MAYSAQDSAVHLIVPVPCSAPYPCNVQRTQSRIFAPVYPVPARIIQSHTTHQSTSRPPQRHLGTHLRGHGCWLVVVEDRLTKAVLNPRTPKLWKFIKFAKGVWRSVPALILGICQRRISNFEIAWARRKPRVRATTKTTRT